MIEQLLNDLKKMREDMVAKNYPFQQLSNLIVKYSNAKAEEMLKVYKGKFDEAIALFQQEMGRNYTAEYEGGI